jgi:predicted DNA-binding transcriptional regulator AlpA
METLQKIARDERANIQRWFSKREIANRYGVTPRSIERWVERGRFPAPVKLPNGRDAWSDVAITGHERGLVSTGGAARDRRAKLELDGRRRDPPPIPHQS